MSFTPFECRCIGCNPPDEVQWVPCGAPGCLEGYTETARCRTCHGTGEVEAPWEVRTEDDMDAEEIEETERQLQAGLDTLTNRS